MKRCPECRRDYYDDSLLYCLDDGSALLDGPASESASLNEPATAILSGHPESGDSPTQILKPARRRTFTVPVIAVTAVVFVAIVSAIAFAIYKFKVKEVSGPSSAR